LLAPAFAALAPLTRAAIASSLCHPKPEAQRRNCSTRSRSAGSAPLPASGGPGCPSGRSSRAAGEGGHRGPRRSSIRSWLCALAPMGCPLLRWRRSCVVVTAFPAVRLHLDFLPEQLPFAAQAARRFLGQAPPGRPPKSARPLPGCGPAKPVQGRLASRIGARLISRPWKSCKTVADQVWGGGRSGRSPGEILGAGWVRAVLGSSGRSRCAAGSSGGHGPAGGHPPPLGLAFFDLLGPLGLPRLALSRPVPSYLEMPRNLAGP